MLKSNETSKNIFEICKQGCLEKSTLISMADGSKRYINDIRIGELLQCKDGMKQVANIWRGREDEYIQITWEHSCTLSATASHPILTMNGWKRASDIVVGDIVCVENGQSQVTDVKTVKADIEVYNLSLSDSENVQAMIANGIYVGDFDTQNSCLECDK